MGRAGMPVALADIAVVMVAVTFTRPREIKGKTEVTARPEKWAW